MSKDICTICLREGHVAASCPKRKRYLGAALVLSVGLLVGCEGPVRSADWVFADEACRPHGGVEAVVSIYYGEANEVRALCKSGVRIRGYVTRGK